MWMHLANRAFLSGASAQKGIPDAEEQGIVVLPSSSRDDIDDGDNDATETIHLINPSMNELMRAITTANQRPIIITQPGSQTNLQRGARRSFSAIDDDELMYDGDVDEEPQPDSLTFVRMLGGGQEHPNYYPHFVREICLNVVDHQDYIRRALSFDDLHFVGGGGRGGGGDNEDIENEIPNILDDIDDGSFFMESDLSSSTEAVLWRAYSEGALISMPGDKNLAQQMAILNGYHPQMNRKADLDQMLTETSLPLAPDETWSPGYWITLAHILAVVACHRWGL